jgi:MFS family permease
MSALPLESTADTDRPSKLSRHFWRLWLANAVNSVGDGAFVAAMPLLAVTVTRDPLLISAITAAEYLPWVLVSLPAGALVDRYDRVKLMWRFQAFQAVITTAVALAVGFKASDMPLLIVASFLLGCAQVVITNAAQSVLPQFVPNELLQRANSNQYVVQTIGQASLGPPIGSLLFTVMRALPFVVDAGSFVVSAGLLASLPKLSGPAAKRLPMKTAISEGLRWLRGHRLLRVLAVVLGINSFCNQMGFATLVLLATDTLRISYRDFGLLIVGMGVGSLLGGLVNARLARVLGVVPAFVVALAASSVVYAGIGLAPDSVVLAVLIAACGLVVTVSSVVTVSLRQQLVPNELLGRVNSVFRMLGWGLMPLGAIAGGLCAQEIGLRAPFLIAGGLRALALLAALPLLIGEARSLKLGVKT